MSASAAASPAPEARHLLAPGEAIGIVGGGQLGRMLAMAAARLGFRVIVLDPDPACPAAQLASETIAADYGDVAALGRLASRTAVVTYEFENVPVEPVRAAVTAVPLYPPADALEIAQDRVVEKAFLNGIGVATAEWRAIDSVEELGHALVELDSDCILKTRRFGYDGKGQANIRREGPHTDAFESLGGVPSILEQQDALRLRMLRDRRPRGGRHGRGVRSGRERPRARHPEKFDRPRPRRPGGRARGRRHRGAGSSSASAMSGSSASSSSSAATAPSSSTRSPRGSTIPATGPRPPAPSRSSSSTSAPSPACRSPPLPATPTASWRTSSATR